MKIRVSDPSLVDDLLWFLEAKQCAVERLSDVSLDVVLAETPRRDAARLEFELYLRVWEALHPDVLVEREPDP
jgi:hypothetical protein